MKLLLTVVFVGIFSMTIFCQIASNKKDLSTAQLNKKLVNDSLLKKNSLSELLAKTNLEPGTADKIDTSLRILYQEKEVDRIAFFVNNKFMKKGYSTLSLINPKDIDSVYVTKDSILIDDVAYYGQIRIKTKHPFNPQLISLQTLKEKYTNLKKKSSIFMIDGVIINEESDKYFVDETSLLRIIIENVQNTKENIDLGLIKILTKTEANINKLKNIILRGMD